MTKTESLLTVLSQSSQVGGGLHTSRELAYLTNTPHSPSFKKFLADCTRRGVLRRVAKDVYESTVTPPNASIALFMLVEKLRKGVLNYISLESQLSYTGDISQIIMDRLTVMTKGRSGAFKTAYGTIEFIHTKKKVSKLAENLYFDFDIKMFRAKTEQAIADLKDCGRNLHMLEN